jgi:hypothetical protein
MKISKTFARQAQQNDYGSAFLLNMLRLAKARAQLNTSS